MSVRLVKGANVSLTKQKVDLTRVIVGLGWSANAYSSAQDYDLDASAFLLGRDGKVLSDKHFVLYGGDARKGSTGNEDDETLDVDLTRVPSECDAVAFSVSIYDADSRKQNFGQVRSAYIRASTPTTAPSSPATTWPRTPPPRGPSSSARSAAAAASGSSAPSAGATAPACAASPSTTASTSSRHPAARGLEDGLLC